MNMILEEPFHVTLRGNLRARMKALNLTPASCEKKAGLRPSSLQNILQGRSRNPTVALLLQTAKTLGCSLSDLLGDGPDQSKSPTFEAEDTWLPELYQEAVRAVLDACQTQDLKPSRAALLKAIDDTYTYCVRYKKTSLDPHFADWSLNHAMKQTG